MIYFFKKSNVLCHHTIANRYALTANTFLSQLFLVTFFITFAMLFVASIFIVIFFMETRAVFFAGGRGAFLMSICS